MMSPAFLVVLLLALVATFTVLAEERDWTLDDFQKSVVQDDRVWLVEFYSSMCGSCKEFSPTWDRIESTLSDVMKTKVNIDRKGGMEIAKQFGALQEGIPNVRLLVAKTGTGLPIMKGDLLPAKKIMHTVSTRLIDLPRENGFGTFLKKELHGSPKAAAEAGAAAGGTKEL